MKKLKTMLFVLLASMATTPIHAGSADFAGPYIAITGSVNGFVADGNALNSNSETTQGTLGKIVPMVGGELGYGLPLGDIFVLGIGASHLPGDAKILIDAGEGDSSGNADDYTVEFKDFFTAYIQPTISVSDNAAFYAKLGVAHVGTELSGNTADGPGGLQGDLYGIGTKTMFGSGIYLQTEAGVIDFEELNFIRVGNTGTANADIVSAYGSMSIGYKF